MADISSLSNELLHLIFKKVEARDIGRLTATCKDFHEYIESNEILYRDIFLTKFVSILSFFCVCR